MGIGERLERGITENKLKSYFAGAAIGTIIMILIALLYGWESLILNSDLLFIPNAFSGIVMRFLSGIGIMLTFASIASITFRATSKSVKNRPGRVRVVKGFLIILAIGIGIYGLLKIVNAVLYNQTITLVETLVAIYGIWSLLFFVYVVPAIRGAYRPREKETGLEKIKKKVGEVRFSIWKGYQTHIWKEHGKVYSKQFERYNTQLNHARQQLSGLLLFPICLILLPIPPLACIALVLWIRIITLTTTPLSRAEGFLLAIIVLTVIILRTWSFLFIELTILNYYFDTVYGLGIFLSIACLVAIISRA